MSKLKSLLKSALGRLGYSFVRLGSFDLNKIDAAHEFIIVTRFTYQGVDFAFASDREWDLIQKQHIQGALYEPEEIALIAKATPRGAVILDIGANIGNHAVYFAKAMGARRVIAVEPGARQRRLLALNASLNGVENVIDILPLALSDRAGEARLVTEKPSNLGAAFLDLAGGAAGAAETVRLARGDDVLPDERIDLIKLDAEGHEMEALAGLTATIARDRPRLFVEVAPDNAEAMRAWIADSGYRIENRYTRYEGIDNLLLAPE